MERALVLVFNWHTKEALTTSWEEENAGVKSYAWRKGIESEYPPAGGWTTCIHMNPEAAQKFAKQIPDKPKA
jgi:hypothetical protein